ncbi:MAG: DUF2905 domain-containing protein [Bryobacterales bacterium]|nr:DUF2905 domain-containing protein [Bryobacterales bacterium]
MGLGRLLIIAGAVMITLGVLISLGPFGRLPGDIVYRGRNVTFYFPLMTSILLSLVLTLVFWLFGRFR